MPQSPRRIVCLSAETVDTLYRLGAGDQVVGVSGFTTTPPEARKKPFVSAFTTIRYDVIESLKPDLIIGFSDLQSDALRELGRRGYQVLLTNQRTLRETFDTILLLGRIVEHAPEAERLVADLERQLDEARASARRLARRPKVYFEEWDEPLISAIAWVSELIEAAGGDDIFPALRRCANASERIVQPETVIERAPEIIIVSWCGKKADLDAIRARPGWQATPAVRANSVYALDSAYCLQPGPMLITEGLPRLCAIMQEWERTQRAAFQQTAGAL